ncbi:phage minor tail protein [Escherichia coli]|nr:phage minor tail protein [Escherichia coli]
MFLKTESFEHNGVTVTLSELQPCSVLSISP